MNESTVNTEMLEEFYSDSLHDMFVLCNDVEEFEKTLSLLKSLCLKMEKYNNAYVLIEDRNSYKKLKDKWQITGYEKILKSIELIETKLKEINAKIEMIDPIISNIDTSREEIEQHIEDIEDILSFGIEEKREVNFNNNNSISEVEVLDSIKRSFTNNREMTNSFNQELYNRVNEEIVNLAKDRGR